MNNKVPDLNVITLDSVSIEMFSKFPDEKDDTGLIQRAIDHVASLGGGKVVLSAKTYKCNIRVPTNVFLEGQHRCHYDKERNMKKGGTILKPSVQGKPVVEFSNKETRLANPRLKGMMIDGSEFADDGITDGISILGAMYPQVEDVTILNCGRWGLNIQNTQHRSTFYGFYKNILIRDCKVNNLRVVWDDLYSTYVTSQYFYGLFMGSNFDKEGSLMNLQDTNITIMGGYCDSVGSYPVSVKIKTRIAGINGTFSLDSASDEDTILRVVSEINNPSIQDVISGDITADGFYEINGIKSSRRLSGVSYSYPKFRNAGLKGYVYFSDATKDTYDLSNPYLYTDNGILSLFLTGSKTKAFQIRHMYNKPIWLKNEGTGTIAAMWVDDVGNIRATSNLSTPSNITDGGILARLVDNIPTSSNANGKKGEFSQDGNHLYICVATNTWKRVEISTW